MKKWYKSKTIATNVITGVAMVAINAGLISVGVPPAQLNTVIAGLLPIINMGLRRVTKEAIKW
jgi:hypothetical protein